MKSDNPVRETIQALEGLLEGLHRQLESDPPKPAISDYLRLVQLRLELGKEYGEENHFPILARWVDRQTLPDPDPDPNVPWAGDEPLT